MDAMMAIGIVMMVVMALIFPFINPTGKNNEEESKPQGNLMVELFWEDGVNVDVDLWVKGPDNIPVGYSNKGGPLFNLLRDDLGVAEDLSGKNMEITYSRGFPDGEYIINAHLFNIKDGTLPVTIYIVVSLRVDVTANDTVATRQLFRVDTVLTKESEEKTLARFFVQDGEYLPETFNNLQEEIRPMYTQGYAQ